MFFFSSLQSIVFQQYFNRMFALGACIKTAVISLIFKKVNVFFINYFFKLKKCYNIWNLITKSLMLSNNARKTSTVGQMINLMTVNVQSFTEFPHHLHMVWSCALSIIVCIFIISIKLNVIAALAGLITMAVFLPFNSFVTNKSKQLQTRKLKFQDSRIKTINEILNGIKVNETWNFLYISYSL